VLDYNEVWDPINQMVQTVDQESDDNDNQDVEYVFEMDLEEDEDLSDDEV
jgi:hypothetical protein